MRRRTVFRLICLIILTSCVPTQRAVDTTPALRKIIDEANVGQLTVLQQWNVDNIVNTSRSGSLWFSDSEQFIISNFSKDYSIHFFRVGSPLLRQSLIVDNPNFSIDQLDRIIENSGGL